MTLQCNTCKQFFSGKLRLDIAHEYSRSTEGMVGGDRAFRHIAARSWVTKAMSQFYHIHLADDYAMIEDEFEKLLSLIKRSYSIYNDSGSGMPNPALSYISSSLETLESEALSNYAMCLSMKATEDTTSRTIDPQKYQAKALP